MLNISQLLILCQDLGCLSREIERARAAIRDIHWGFLGILTRKLVKYLIKNLTWVLNPILSFILVILIATMNWVPTVLRYHTWCLAFVLIELIFTEGYCVLSLL